MDWKIFYKNGLKFGQRLKRLHHMNAIFFLFLAVTGFILFSTAFRSAYPTLRVLIRSGHVWIGFISVLPIVFYLPKMTKHLVSLKRKLNHRKNLYFILTLLSLLVISGVILSLHRDFPPFISSLALFIHDITTIVGVPYIAFHSVTRSQWFKKLTKPKTLQEQTEEPMLIDESNPIYKRRTFLRVATGSLIGIAFAPFFFRWLNTLVPSVKTQTSLPQGNHFETLPQPNPRSLPPVGGGRKGTFRYYTVTEIPSLNDQTFRFTIDGLVNHPKSYQWSDFLTLHRTVQVSDFHCVTGWSVYKITWEGLPLRSLLAQAGVKKNAKYVKFYSADGVYTDTLTIKQAMQQDVMVALLIDGQLIDQNNGGPVRLIVPKMYAYKSVKWLNRIELIEQDETGYWEKRGYPKNAWVKSL